MVDSELNKQRHIYDAFLNIDKRSRPDLEFRFDDAYFEDKQKQKIKLSKISKKNKIIPTLTGTDSFVIDRDDNQFFAGQINKIAGKEGISKEISKPNIHDCINFSKTSKPGDVYNDYTFGIKVVAESTHTKPVTIMSGKTPHRSLSKACVELAHALGISQQISNFDTLRKHALYGDQLQKIRAFQKIRVDCDAMPFHLIQFTEDQFHIHFFLKYATSIKISWVGKPEIIILAEDLLTRDLRICQPHENQLEITKYVLNLKALENYLHHIE